MLERTITSTRVEARAFLGGARKVRYFDSVEEADAWFRALHAKHEGVNTETRETTTTLGVGAPRLGRVEREWKEGER